MNTKVPSAPRRRRLLATLVAALALVVLGPGPAAAGRYVDQAVAALKNDKVKVYVAQDASTIGADAADKLRQQIAGTQRPIYIAVLPKEALAEGNPDELLKDIANGVHITGAYALLVESNEGGFRAGASNLAGYRRGVVPAAATAAFDANKDNPEAMLTEFVERVGTAPRGSASGESQGGDPVAAEGGSGGGGGAGVAVLLGILGIGALGGGLMFFRSRRRRREEQQRQLEQVKSAANDDLIALSNDLQAIDLDVKMPGANPDAQQHYATAVASYERAANALDRAARPEDLAAVSAALEEGRYSVAAAKALLEGRQLPERRPPCFFDPRHGPSVRDVAWTPPGGATREVPACAADAQRVESGLEPETRKVLVGGRQEPFYNAPGYYAPWYGGYFGGFGGGGLLTGVLLGTALSGGFGGWGGGGYGAGYDAGFEQGQDAGGGDFGGDGGDGGGWGDFGGGGGDFGGGDFGGGDFGGGDFGGGDF